MLEPVQNHCAREVIFRRDDEPDGLHLVMDGVILLRSTGADGRPFLHGIAMKGAWFGEVAALTGERQQFEAVSFNAPVRTARISQRVLNRMLGDDPAVVHYFLQMAVSRYRFLAHREAATLYGSPTARVASAITGALCVDVPQLVSRPVRDVPVSQGALSEMTGLARQTVNRVLKALSEAEVLRCAYGTITVLDLPRLERMMNGCPRERSPGP